MGMGSLKMLGMIGAFLGWQLMLFSLMFGSFLGSFVGLALIVAKRKSLSDQLPFGCFLAIGAIAAIFVGQPFMD
jgi:leader peptidase (prepilin peptidase)/N-methyltransferase